MVFSLNVWRIDEPAGLIRGARPTFYIQSPSWFAGRGGVGLADDFQDLSSS